MSISLVNQSPKNNSQNFDHSISGPQVTEIISNNESEKPKWFSQIDKTQEISETMWAVSMLIENGRGKVPNWIAHHTILIIEGVDHNSQKELEQSQKELEQFWRKAHLRGPGSNLKTSESTSDCFTRHSKTGRVELTEVKWYSTKNGKFKLSGYKDHRQTWVRKRALIENMIQRIHWEKDHPDSTPFKLLGENSFLARQYEYIDTSDPDLIELEKNDPKKFKELVDLKKMDNLFKKTDFKDRRGFLEKVSSYSSVFTMFSVAFGISPLVLSIGWGTGIVWGCAAVWRQMKERWVGIEIEKNQELLKVFDEKGKECMMWSQNCFNAGRRWLKMVEVDVPERPSEETICSIPSFYLPNKNQEM